ncbi:hypothetical protein [Actinomycetospora aeridis]|uniref:Uncharacterized protein n=1 Tax=Actinomycetospora aeridis TaxID=3129231 RepID=A0ABU8NCD7_9PSEU
MEPSQGIGTRAGPSTARRVAVVAATSSFVVIPLATASTALLQLRRTAHHGSDVLRRD